MKKISFNEKKIFYTDRGKGKTILLLHGFSETSRIWKNFEGCLRKDFRVIRIDLPGHGNSECLGEVHSMELFADVVHAVLEQAKVRKCLLVGHSMGGYATLAFARKYPDMLKGFVIFHSHCFADTPEEQENRDRTVELVNNDKSGFLAQYIPGLFPEEVREKFAREIKKMVKRASEMPKEGIVADIQGMKTRPDQTEVLRMTNLPVLFILGLKDVKAPLSRLWDMISLPAHSESLIFRDAGHMGYIEAPDETLETIRHFAKRVL